MTTGNEEEPTTIRFREASMTRPIVSVSQASESGVKVVLGDGLGWIQKGCKQLKLKNHG